MHCRAVQCNVVLCPSYGMWCHIKSWFSMPLYVVLDYAALCYAALCYDMLCYDMLCYVMMCCVMLCHAAIGYVTPCFAILCCVACLFLRLRACCNMARVFLLFAVSLDHALISARLRPFLQKKPHNMFYIYIYITYIYRYRHLGPFGPWEAGSVLATLNLQTLNRKP